MSKRIKQEISLEVTAFAQLEKWQQELIHKAEEAAINAYAPYSNFLVGAALLTNTGKIIQGNNQENSAFPSGLCAERVAVFSARAQHPEEKIKAIVVTAKQKTANEYTAVTPCGSCRQVLSEVESNQEQPIHLIMAGAEREIYISDSIENLLPFKFSSKYLK